MKADTIIESVKKALGWVGVLLALSGPSALGAAYDFTINMNGSQEVPVNLVPGTGAGVASYDDVSNLLTWSMTWSDLTGPAAGIHFHGPAGVGTNAAVQVNLGAISGLTSPTFGAVVISEVQEAQLLNSLWFRYHYPFSINTSTLNHIFSDSSLSIKIHYTCFWVII